MTCNLSAAPCICRGVAMIKIDEGRTDDPDALATCLRLVRAGHRGASAPWVRSWASDEELEWLRRLAAGARVPDLARAGGVPERTLYRRLRALYRRLGVRDRDEAVRLVVSVGLARDQGERSARHARRSQTTPTSEMAPSSTS